MTTERTDLEVIAARLARLERQNRRLKWLVLVFMAAAVGTWAGAELVESPVAAPIEGNDKATEPLRQMGRIMEAEAFFLIDAKGNRRGALAMTEEGPALHLADSKGNRRIALGMTKRGPILQLSDPNGRPRLVLAASKVSTALQGWDSKGNPRVVLGVREDGTRLHLADANSVVRAAINVAQAKPTIELKDAEEKTIWSAP